MSLLIAPDFEFFCNQTFLGCHLLFLRLSCSTLNNTRCLKYVNGGTDVSMHDIVWSRDTHNGYSNVLIF